eukprot:gene3093-6067_t
MGSAASTSGGECSSDVSRTSQLQSERAGSKVLYSKNSLSDLEHKAAAELDSNDDNETNIVDTNKAEHQAILSSGRAQKYQMAEEGAQKKDNTTKKFDTSLIQLEKVRVAEVKWIDKDDTETENVHPTSSQCGRQNSQNHPQIQPRGPPRPFVTPSSNGSLPISNRTPGTATAGSANRIAPMRPAGVPPSSLPVMAPSALIPPSSSSSASSGIQSIPNPYNTQSQLQSQVLPTVVLPAVKQQQQQRNMQTTSTTHEQYKKPNTNTNNNKLVSDESSPLSIITKITTPAVLIPPLNEMNNNNSCSNNTAMQSKKVEPELRIPRDSIKSTNKNSMVRDNSNSLPPIISTNSVQESESSGSAKTFDTSDDDDDDEDEDEDGVGGKNIAEDEVYDWTAFNTAQGNSLIANAAATNATATATVKKSVVDIIPAPIHTVTPVPGTGAGTAMPSQISQEIKSDKTSDKPLNTGTSPKKLTSRSTSTQSQVNVSNRQVSGGIKNESGRFRIETGTSIADINGVLSKEDEDADDDKILCCNLQPVEDSRRPHFVPALLNLPQPDPGRSPSHGQQPVPSQGGQNPPSTKAPNNNNNNGYYLPTGPKPPFLNIALSNGPVPPPGNGNVHTPVHGGGMVGPSGNAISMNPAAVNGRAGPGPIVPVRPFPGAPRVMPASPSHSLGQSPGLGPSKSLALTPFPMSNKGPPTFVPNPGGVNYQTMQGNNQIASTRRPLTTTNTMASSAPTPMVGPPPGRGALRPVMTPTDSNRHTVKETADVKRNRAQMPSTLSHATPTTGDWSKRRYIVNNYILLDVLGAGSYGEVRMAKDRISDKIFALKILSKEFLKKRKNGHTTETYFEDIKREIAIMKKLMHPNVLRLFEVLDDPNVNKIYLVLEYMKKGDLICFLKEREKLDPKSVTPQQNQNQSQSSIPIVSEDELWHIFRQVCAGVRYLHFQNVVHGDIKPQNLLVGEDGVVKIADFGISKMLSGSSQKLADAAGTPAFMSPELCELRNGVEFSGQLADVWALGATMFMLKFGHPPFIAGNQLLLFTKIQNDPLVFPFVINPSLQDLLENMLIKDPQKRYTLLQVFQHPWFQRPPIPTSSSAINLNLIVTNTPTHAHHTMHSTGFRPPPSYDEEQAKAMEGPVHKADNNDIFMSINYGTQTHTDEVVKGKHGNNSSTKGNSNSNGSSGALKPVQSGDGVEDSNTDQIIGLDADNIMATNWGNDVFDQVEDESGGASEDDDDDDDDDCIPIKSTKPTNEQSAVTAAAAGGGSQSQSQIQIQRELMAQREEEERAKRFRDRMARKSKGSIATLPKLHELQQRSMVMAENGPVVTNTQPMTLHAAARRSGSGNGGGYGGEDSCHSMSTHSSLAQRRGSHDLVIVTQSTSESARRADNGSDLQPEPDELYIDKDEDLEDSQALNMEEFESLMDTLSKKDRRDSLSTTSSRPMSLASSISAIMNACMTIPHKNRNYNNNVASVHVTAQGTRSTQEDRVIFISDLSHCENIPLHLKNNRMNELQHLTVGCIFDGHSGDKCSEYLSRNILCKLLASERFLEIPIEDTLRDVFQSIDEEVCTLLRRDNDESGCTGTVAIVDGRKNEFIIANIGDSGCVLCRGGKAISLLPMHRPSDKEEKIRIESAGGKVMNNRVNGILAISRAFGDVQFKSYEGNAGLLTASPDLTTEDICGAVEFAVVASDGLWDVMTPQVVVDYIRKRASVRGSLPLVAQDLVHEALKQGSVDNVTMLIFVFNIPIDEDDEGLLSSSQKETNNIIQSNTNANANSHNSSAENFKILK